jgi:Zn-dependent protease
MPSKGIPLFKIAGIQVYLHWAWFLFAVFEIQRMNRYSTVLWSALEYLTLFGIVLMHEFGHALACRQVGGRASQIVLWPLGGVAYVEAPPRPGATLWSIAAGPLVNLALVPVLAIAYFAVSIGAADETSDLVSFLWAVNFMNAVLLIFNLLPIYPLDGGKILRSVLWYVVGRAKSLMAAVIIGFVGVGLLGVLMVIATDRKEDLVWPIVLLVFAGSQCFNGFKHAQALRKLEAMPRRDNFSCPSCGARPPMGVLWTCAACQTMFDTFETGAICPQCRASFSATQCIDCGVRSAPAAWSSVPAEQTVPPRIHYERSAPPL